MKRLLSLLLVPVLCVFAVGCTAAQGAQTADSVLKGILAVAQDEESALPAADAAIMAPWVSLGQTLEGQLSSCITGAASGSKASAFVGCFNSFASGLLNPTEMAQLRIMSAKSQSHVQTVVTAIVIAVNGAFTAYNAATQVAPVVATTPPAAAEIIEFSKQVESKMDLPTGTLAAYAGF